MKTPYDDIIGLPHHVSSSRPRMSAHNRAAQFAPFAALTGYDAAVSETARLTGKYVELDDGEKEAINERLRMVQECIDQQPEIHITYFVPDKKKAGGAYVDASGLVKKIDSYGRFVVMCDGTNIPIDEIIRIEGELFQAMDSI
jgi:hypothetical protein